MQLNSYVTSTVIQRTTTYRNIMLENWSKT